MTPLDPRCQEALKQHCLATHQNPNDPELVELARLICGAGGAASLADWLTPRSQRRELLATLDKACGTLSAAQLAFAEKLLNEGKSIGEIVSRVSLAVLQDVVARTQQAKDELEASEGAEHCRERGGFTP